MEGREFQFLISRLTLKFLNIFPDFRLTIRTFSVKNRTSFQSFSPPNSHPPLFQNSRLINGSILWKKWTVPDYRIRFNLFVYSMKNPDEFMNGAIPEVSGSGPYVFDKKLENRVVSAENGTVKYQRFLSYFFNEQESCQTCILGNRIWVPNMIYQVSGKERTSGRTERQREIRKTPEFFRVLCFFF